MIELSHETYYPYWVNPEHIQEVYKGMYGDTVITILGQNSSEKVKESPQEVLTKIKLFKEKNND